MSFVFAGLEGAHAGQLGVQPAPPGRGVDGGGGPEAPAGAQQIQAPEAPREHLPEHQRAPEGQQGAVPQGPDEGLIKYELDLLCAQYKECLPALYSH